MTLSNAVKQRIIDLAKGKKMTLHKYALQSGVPYSTLSSFLNGKCASITLTTLLHLCDGAGIKLKDFFADPIFRDVTIEENDVTEKR